MAIDSKLYFHASNNTITGGATVKQPGQGSIAGERIVYNMRTGQVQAGGEKGVHLQFEPRNRTPGVDAKPAGSKPAGSN